MMSLTKLWARMRGSRSTLLLWFTLLSIFLVISITFDLHPLLSRQLLHFRETFHDSITRKDVETRVDTFEDCMRPLRVYMYELPQKFNFGMLKPGGDGEIPWSDQKVPSWPMGSGLRKQHSVEYWMTLNLLDSHSRQKTAIRVADPNNADVFFVPFFSSLSYNPHGVNMLDPETEKDRLLQVEIVDRLHNTLWWQKSAGQDHILVMHHPNALRFVREKVNASIFVVADFGRFSQRVARLRKDVVAPYVHVVDTYLTDNLTNPFEARRTLLFFRGTIRRKADGVVRTKLAKLLQNYSNVVYEESAAKNGGIELATQGMRQSRFCLTPAGDTPSSCRLFDAIASHCVPVIISDKLELPFEDELNYEEFCLIFSVEEALTPGYILEILENFSKERWLSMWTKLKLVAHHFEYQHPALNNDAVDMVWKQVQRKLPAIRLAKHRLKRLKIPDWWHW
ncbi:hypothetical protein L7F22_062961 [Adiantum nelumboides]|nr:hypothetical protein [Adiantum nelumboides]